MLLAAAPAFAQDGMAAMRDLLDRGYWNSAAQLNGPNLIEQRPTDPEAHLLYATALYLTGNLDAAAERLTVASSLTTSLPASHVHLAALIRAANGDDAGAVQQLQNAFIRQPDYQYAMDWGRVAWQAGMTDAALQAFTAASETDRGSLEPWPDLARGRVLSAIGRYQEAVAAFQRSLDIYETTDSGEPRPPGPAYVEAWYRLGEAYEALGDLASAEAAYKAARTVDPNYLPAVQAVDRLARRLD